MGELSLMAGAGAACLRGRDELRTAAGRRLWCERGLFADDLQRRVRVGWPGPEVKRRLWGAW